MLAAVTAAPPGVDVCVAIRWNDWPKTGEDYDLYLVGPGNTLLASSTYSQADDPSDPTEEACLRN